MRDHMQTLPSDRAATLLIADFDALTHEQRSALLLQIAQQPRIAAWTLTMLSPAQAAKLRASPQTAPAAAALVQSIAADPWAAVQSVPSFAILAADDQRRVIEAAARSQNAAQRLLDAIARSRHAPLRQAIVDDPAVQHALIAAASAARDAPLSAIVLQRFFNRWTDDQRLALTAMAAEDSFVAARLLVNLLHHGMLDRVARPVQRMMMQRLAASAAQRPESAALAASALALLDDEERVMIIAAASRNQCASHAAWLRLSAESVLALGASPGGAAALADVIRMLPRTAAQRPPYAWLNAWNAPPAHLARAIIAALQPWSDPSLAAAVTSWFRADTLQIVMQDETIARLLGNGTPGAAPARQPTPSLTIPDRTSESDGAAS